MRRVTFFAIIIYFLSLLGLSTALSAHDTVVIAGTGDSQKMLRLLGLEYCRTHPNVLIEVPESVGSSGGIKALLEGRCDLARMGRPLTAKESFYNLSYLLFAKSPIVFAVHENVGSIENLTKKMLLDIYAGRIRFWEALGAFSGKIYIANREKGDSSRNVIESVIPAFARIDPFAGKILYTTPEVARVLSTYENTFGYLPLSAVLEKNVRVLNFAGVPATPATVQSKTYPLVVPLGLVWHGVLDHVAADFVTFIGSSAGAKIILDSGAYPASEFAR